MLLACSYSTCQGVLSWVCRLLQPLQLIFYGDDVTVEQYQGDCEHPGCAEGPAVFQKYFGEWRSAAFGITGARLAPRAQACSRPAYSAVNTPRQGSRPASLSLLLYPVRVVMTSSAFGSSHGLYMND